MTTRVRAFYERRYKKRTREPLSRIVFVFDMILVVIIGWLLLTIVFASLREAYPSFITRFQSASFSVASPTPVAVSIKVAEGSGLHRNVRAFWKLPSGVEVIESNPRMISDGSIYLGNLSKGQEVRLHLIVRAYRPIGDHVTIGLQIQEGGLFDVRTAYTSMSGVVSEGGLFAEIPKELLADHVVPKGAVLPIRVKNQTDETIRQVEIRPTDDSAMLFDRQALGDLEPHSERYVYLPLEGLKNSVSIGWSLVASSYIVSSSTWHADLMEWSNAPKIRVETDIDSARERNPRARVDIQDLGDASLVVVNPTVSSTISEWQKDGEFYFYIRSASTSERVVLTPVGRLKDSSSRILGPAKFLFIPGPLPFKASIRYTSVSGDQIGAGPNPPEANTETRYWVFFTVEQSKVPLKNVHVRANFPKGVELTGSVAVPDGGTWTNSRQLLDWKLPTLASDKASVEIGAEISITPNANSVAPYQLISSVMAEATDAKSGLTIEAERGVMTTEDVDGN